jgi:hypothetical protein
MEAVKQAEEDMDWDTLALPLPHREKPPEAELWELPEAAALAELLTVWEAVTEEVMLTLGEKLVLPLPEAEMV